MPSSEFGLPDGTRLVCEQDMQFIPYESYMEHDPGWRFTDAAGHEHYREGDGSFPTLLTVWQAGWCGLCGDWHEEGDVADHYECRACGETVRPGTRRHPGGVITVTGQRYFRRTGRVAVSSASEAERLMRDGYATAAVVEHGQVWAEIDEPLTPEQVRELLRTVTRHGSAQ